MHLRPIRRPYLTLMNSWSKTLGLVFNLTLIFHYLRTLSPLIFHYLRTLSALDVLGARKAKFLWRHWVVYLLFFAVKDAFQKVIAAPRSKALAPPRLLMISLFRGEKWLGPKIVRSLLITAEKLRSAKRRHLHVWQTFIEEHWNFDEWLVSALYQTFGLPFLGLFTWKGSWGMIHFASYEW